MNRNHICIAILLTSTAVLTGMVAFQKSELDALRKHIAASDAGPPHPMLKPKSAPLSTLDSPRRQPSATNESAPDTGGSGPKAPPPAWAGKIKATPIPGEPQTEPDAPIPAEVLAAFSRPALSLEEARALVEKKVKIAGKGPAWSHDQITGPPDTEGGGDVNTAWAPRSIHSGEQWIQLGYDSPVEISGINVHETYCPGAMSKVTALMPDGTEQTLWTGTEPAADAASATEVWVPAPPGITSNRIRVYVDTDRVQSWPEIDAVELVGAQGQRQWATSSTASSHYGDAQAMVDQSQSSLPTSAAFFSDGGLQLRTTSENPGMAAPR